MVELLNKLRIDNTLPAFNDLESATAIELVSKVYSKMNELIKEHNSFVDNVNKTIEDFKNSTTKDLEAFEVALRQEFQDFIDVINLKIMSQDNLIEGAIDYMKNNLEATVTEQINTAINDGRIVIGLNYNETTENLDVVAVPIDEGGVVNE